MVSTSAPTHLFVLLAAVVLVAAAIWAIVDVATRPFLRGVEKYLWIVAVVVFPGLGAAVWFSYRARRPWAAGTS